MPWCDTCDHYVKPEDVDDGGKHSECGSEVDVADQRVEMASPRAPWHFKLMVVLLVLYLGWRLVQFVLWIFGRL
ncbi:MAG: hypothetical protein R2706_09255 [Acidimicrobiales bacterium]